MNSNTARAIFFEGYPEPMWVYELSTLRILDVNDAAIVRYGFEREEFLSMTLRDLRLPDDLPALEENVQSPRSSVESSGIWKHRLKSGETIFVDIRSHTVEYEGRAAALVSARDVTETVELHALRERVLEQEKVNREKAEATAAYFQALFESIPGNYVVLEPVTLKAVAVSDAYLAAMHLNRESILGRSLVSLLSDQASEDAQKAKASIAESLQRVQATGTTDYMDVSLYPLAETAMGNRLWSIINKPVSVARGQVAFTIHRVLEVTPTSEGTALSWGDTVHEMADFDLGDVVDADQLRGAVLRLQHKRTMLRHAQRLVGMGTWERNLLTDELHWSDGIYKVFDVDSTQFDGTYEGFLKLVHPDDRTELDRLQRVAQETNEVFDHTHRIVRPDGEVRIVREVAEVVQTLGGPVYTGAVQDVTDQKISEMKLRETSAFLSMAGRTGRFGGWRADLITGTVHWTRETCAIHEVEGDYTPSMEDGFSYYVPEHRERLRELVGACVDAGTPFDQVSQIRTAKGNLIWVRVTGEAVRARDNTIMSIQGSFQDVSELVSAREAATAAAAELALTLESITDGFFALNDQWRFTFMNAEGAALLNRKREELLGTFIWDEFSDPTISIFRSKYEEAIRDQVTKRFTSYYAELGKWFEVNAYPAGAGIAVHFRDVTDVRAQHEQLSLLSHAVEHLNDIVLITEASLLHAPDGPRIVFVNDAFTRVTGFSREEAIGKTPRILQGEKTQRGELDRISDALQRSEQVRAEIINYSKSGEEYWLELDIVPLRSRDGVLTHFVAIERDITERKRTEAIVAVSQERFRLLARATNDVVWDWDIPTNSLWFNEGYELMFGDTPVVEDGFESFGKHIHAFDRQRVLSTLHGLMAGGPTTWTMEYRCIARDNRVIWVSDRGFVIREINGIASRMLGSLVDVSKRYEKDERVRQSQKLEAVGQLTGGIAHDFNNLLTVILGNAEMLAEELEDRSDLLTLANQTASAAQRGAELTGRLLAFARRQALEPEILDVSKLVSSMYDMLRRTLSEDIEVEIVRGGGLWKVEVDPGQLEMAILNLAINARDAMPRGGRLTIETANALLDDAYSDTNEDIPAGQYVLISISDTGTGMRPEIAARAFEPFFTTKAVGKGTGLGLSMIYGFVKQSGGHIKIYSEVDHGTSLKMYLPRSASSQETTHELPGSRRYAGGSEHILVVEDDAMVRDNLVAQLKLLGYKITTAEDGPEALVALRQDHSISLLFTDIVMPGGMNGRQLADQAKVFRPDLRVLCTSGYTENAIVHHGRVDRGVHLLSKPYRRQELAMKVRKVLEHG